MNKLKFESDFFKCYNKFIFYNFFDNFFYKFFFIYIKMSKNLSAKYCQENKERLQKKARQRCQNLSKEQKQKLVQYRKKYCRMR